MQLYFFVERVEDSHDIALFLQGWLWRQNLTYIFKAQIGAGNILLAAVNLFLTLRRLQKSIQES
ncbi:hypothetical protein AQ768_22220 [Burkholderia pseudomallei]|nr:hypothetical protein AQ768_22220 [Burkholderia pseudomallei]